MTYSVSFGYSVRIRFCSASATFLAAWKEPRSAIDQERSTISTVAVVVTISVR